MEASKAGLHPMNPGDLQTITDAPSAVDSVIAVVRWLEANQTLTADEAGKVVNGCEAHRTALEPALIANVSN